MNRKLTLRLDEDVIERAKQYAEERGTSVSQLVERFFEQLESSSEASEAVEISPLVKSLRGIIADVDLSENEYYEHLGKKHE